MLRTILGLKLKKLRTSQGFKNFGCSNKKKRVFWNDSIYSIQEIYFKNTKGS